MTSGTSCPRACPTSSSTPVRRNRNSYQEFNSFRYCANGLTAHHGLCVPKPRLETCLPCASLRQSRLLSASLRQSYHPDSAGGLTHTVRALCSFLLLLDVLLRVRIRAEHHLAVLPAGAVTFLGAHLVRNCLVCHMSCAPPNNRSLHPLWTCQRLLHIGCRVDALSTAR